MISVSFRMVSVLSTMVSVLLRMMSVSFKMISVLIKMVSVSLRMVYVSFKMVSVSFRMVSVSFGMVSVSFKMMSVLSRMVSVSFGVGFLLFVFVSSVVREVSGLFRIMSVLVRGSIQKSVSLLFLGGGTVVETQCIASLRRTATVGVLTHQVATRWRTTPKIKTDETEDGGHRNHPDQKC